MTFTGQMVIKEICPYIHINQRLFVVASVT